MFVKCQLHTGHLRHERRLLKIDLKIILVHGIVTSQRSHWSSWYDEMTCFIESRKAILKSEISWQILAQ